MSVNKYNNNNLLRGEGQIDARAAVELEAQILAETSCSHSVTNKIVLGRLKKNVIKKNELSIK